MGLGTFFIFYNLGTKSLWLDEINGLQIASQPFPRMISSIIGSDHPPLFHFIQHFFLAPGYDEFSARLPAAVFGVLSILAIFILGRNTLGEIEGLMGAALLATSAINIANAQNARNYSFFVFLSILSLNSFYLAFWKNRKGHYWFWVVLNVLAVYAHYFGLFLVFSEVAFALVYFIRTRRKIRELSELRHLIWGSLITGIAFLPWVYAAFFRQAAHGVGYFNYFLEPQPNSFLVLVNYFVYGVWDILTFRYPKTPLMVLGILTLIGIVGKRNPEKNAGINLLTFFPLIVLVTVFSLAFARVKVITPRNLLFIFPCFYLLVGRGILLLSQGLLTRVFPKNARRYQLTGAFVLGVVLLGRLNYQTLVHYYNEGFHLEDYRGSWKQVVSFVKENLNPDDQILIWGKTGTSGYCLDYYLEKERLEDRVEFVESNESLRRSLDRMYQGFLLIPHAGSIYQDEQLIKTIRENLISARHFFGEDIYYLSRSPFRLEKYHRSIARIGEKRPPVVIDAGEYISASIFPLANVVQGRYAATLFNGGNLIYRFYCENKGIFSIDFKLFKGREWIGSPQVRFILDSESIGNVNLERTDHWVRKHSGPVFIPEGYHHLILEMTGDSDPDAEKAIYLDEIIISPSEK